MKRGFTKAWRKELESEIWLMPPLYHRVWYWIRLKVQHEPFLFPTRRLFGIWVLPGQRLTSIQDIANGVKWTDNHREITPDKRAIVRVLEWLEFQGNIILTCNAFGTLIHIINWHTYNQNHEEPVTLSVQPDVQGYAHKKRMLKNEKETKEKEDKVKRFVPPSAEEVTAYCFERKNGIDPQRWINHYTANGWMVGKSKMKDWQASIRTWEGNDHGSNRPSSSTAASGRKTGIIEANGAGTDFLS